jgi:hypothetical protein
MQSPIAIPGFAGPHWHFAADGPAALMITPSARTASPHVRCDSARKSEGGPGESVLLGPRRCSIQRLRELAGCLLLSFHSCTEPHRDAVVLARRLRQAVSIATINALRTTQPTASTRRAGRAPTALLRLLRAATRRPARAVSAGWARAGQTITVLGSSLHTV